MGEGTRKEIRCRGRRKGERGEDRKIIRCRERREGKGKGGGGWRRQRIKCGEWEIGEEAEVKMQITRQRERNRWRHGHMG